MFPQFTAQVRNELATHVRNGLNTLAAQPNASLYSVLVTPQNGFPAPLAPLYDTGNTGLRRSGLLLHPAVLSANSGPTSTTPVHRGIFFMSRLFCMSTPPPPANVSTVLPPGTGNQTTRERLVVHEQNPSCAGCHKLMDPIGLAFEQFDSIGRARTLENGKVIDVSGEVGFLKSQKLPFQTVDEFVYGAANNVDVHQCFVKQAFRYFFGRQETAGDHPVLRNAYRGFLGSELRLRDLFLSFVQSDAFLTRQGIIQ